MTVIKTKYQKEAVIQTPSWVALKFKKFYDFVRPQNLEISKPTNLYQ